MKLIYMYVILYLSIQYSSNSLRHYSIYNSFHYKKSSLNAKRNENIDVQQIFDSNDKEYENLSIEELVQISKDEQKEIEIQLKSKENEMKNDLYKKRKDKEYEAYWLRQSKTVKNMKNNINSQALYKAYYSLNTNESLSDKLDVDMTSYNENIIGKSIKKKNSNYIDKKPFYTSRGTSIGTTSKIVNWQENVINKSSTNKLLTKNLLKSSITTDISNEYSNDMNDLQNNALETNNRITSIESISSNNILDLGLKLIAFMTILLVIQQIFH